MSSFSVIRPRDDAEAQQASDWADNLVQEFTNAGHFLTTDVDDTTPADAANVLGVLGGADPLVCYFGHGDANSLLANGSATADVKTIQAMTGMAIVAIACKTASGLAPAAIKAGAEAWLGFTISLPVIAPHKGVDPIGEAIVRGLAGLGNHGTMQQALNDIKTEMHQVVADHDTTGIQKDHPRRWEIYYGALATRDHVVLHGRPGCAPL